MSWSRAIGALLFSAAVLLSRGTVDAAVQAADRIWYNPNPGTLDLIDMFEQPSDWPRVRSMVNVFEFTQQHTHTTPDRLVGPNTFTALANANVFRTLKQWGLKTAVGVGAVKEFYCTPDSSGMDAAIADGLNAASSIAGAGGSVSYFALDEPFLSGQSRVCGGPAMEPTADRLKTYFTAIHAQFPAIAIGLVEAYPSFSPAQFGTMLDLMQARGISPAFVHVDVDIRAVRPPREMTTDMQLLKSIAAAHSVPMGIMIWGYNGDADVLFALDAERLTNAFAAAFPTWSAMPQQIIFASFSDSSTGLRITPANLPETRQYTLTNILWLTYRRLVGATGPVTDVAIHR